MVVSELYQRAEALYGRTHCTKISDFAHERKAAAWQTHRGRLNGFMDAKAIQKIN